MFKNLNRSLSLLLVATTPHAIGMLGQTINPDQAAARISQTIGRHTRALSSAELKHKETITLTDNQTPGCYLFSTPDNQTVIASADQRQKPILAIIDNPYGSDIRTSPAATLIDLYLSETQNLQKIQTSTQTSTRAYDEWQTVKPLLSTQWRQSYPYNMLIPSDMPTGCVATAMAQVIYYHKYALGKGANTYFCQSLGKDLSYTFEGHQFDFSNMLPNYNGSSTEQQRNAVADLMLACGISLNMEYNKDNSVVSVSAAAPALVRHFSYDPKGTATFTGDGLTRQEWDAIIYEELAAGRPVLYGGMTREGAGHAFVCDGYLYDNLFHINWGWGMYDGYFALSSLNPAAVYPSGLTMGQMAVTAFVPGKGEVIDRTRYFAAITSASPSSMTLLWRMSGTSEEKRSEFGVMAHHIPSGRKIFVPGSDFIDYNCDNLPSIPAAATLKFDFKTALNATGEWKLFPAVRDQGGEPRLASGMRNYSPSAFAIVGETGMYIGLDPKQVGKLEISDFKILEPMYQDGEARLQFTVSNTTGEDFQANLGVCMEPDGPVEGAYGKTSVWLQLKNDQTATVTPPTFSLYDKATGSMKPGNYKIWFVNIDADNALASDNVFSARILAPGEQPESSVSAPDSDQILKTEWYNLQGIRIPQPAGICIQKRHYTSGKTTSSIVRHQQF